MACRRPRSCATLRQTSLSDLRLEAHRKRTLGLASLDLPLALPPGHASLGFLRLRVLPRSDLLPAVLGSRLIRRIDVGQVACHLLALLARRRRCDDRGRRRARGRALSRLLAGGRDLVRRRRRLLGLLYGRLLGGRQTGDVETRVLEEAERIELEHLGLGGAARVAWAEDVARRGERVAGLLDRRGSQCVLRQGKGVSHARQPRCERHGRRRGRCRASGGLLG